MEPVSGAVRRPRLPLTGPTSPIRGAIPDEQLVVAARSGDRYAWELLVRRYQGLVFRCAYLLTRDASLAEEVTLSTCIRAFRGLDSLDGDSSIRPRLMRVTSNTARTRLREISQRRNSRPSEPQPIPRLPADPFAPSHVRAAPTPLEHEALAAAFDRLGDDDRVVLASRYVLALSRAEMAAYLATAEEDVVGRLRSALGRLRTYLADGTPAGPAPGPNATDERYRVSELPAHHFTRLDDDTVGFMAARAAFVSVPWKPDVAPAATERLARDAAAYPEQFAIPPSGPYTEAPSTASTASGSVATARQAGLSARRNALAGVGLVAVVAVLAASAYVGDLGVQLPQLTGSSAEDSAPAMAAAELVADPAEVAEPAAAEVAAMPVIEAPPVPVADVAPAPVADVAPAPVADAPDLTRPAWTIVEARTVRSGAMGARVKLDWPTGEIDDAIASTQLHRKLGSGGWKQLASTEAGAPIDLTLVPDRLYELRVRSLDEDGEVLLSQRIRVRLDVHDWDSSRIERTSGEWGLTTTGALASTSEDAVISASFKGAGVALVAPTWPAGGAMRVRVDEGDWERGELRQSRTAEHSVVYSEDLELGPHSLDITVDQGPIALDSMMVVRTTEAWSKSS